MNTPCQQTVRSQLGIPLLAHFDQMIDNCARYVEQTRAQGRPLVGIMCEFSPRELILAAGAVPVCLCGGSAETVIAAEQVLPSNVCPLIKSTFGYHLKGTNPFLRQAALVVAETTCDGKKKMFELLGATKPMYVLELPQKSGTADALDRWYQEIRTFRDFLEARFGRPITDAALRQAIALMNRERRARRGLADLMTADDPPLTGRELLECKSIISGIEADLDAYEKALAAFQGQGAPPPARSPRPVRVLLTGVPLVHGAERVLEVIESCGAVVVCSENCTGLKPILEDVDETAPDPLRALAEKYFHLPCSVMTPNDGRFETLRTLAGRFRPQCVIELVWQACLTYDIESYRVRQFVEQELGLPYLKIVTDYSPSDSARIKARVEALLEITREKAAPKPPSAAQETNRQGPPVTQR